MLAKKRDPGGRRWKSTSRFAAQDFAVADGEGDFGEDGNVLGGGETPAGEHGFELRGEFGGGEFSEWSRPDVKMCTWLFQKPAVTTMRSQWMTVTARAKRGGLVVALGPTAVMRPL